MVVLGDDARLDVELFAPSRAIGFARVGERVRLMYDAFPYQQFGTFGGTVTRISRTALGPDEIAAPRSEEHTSELQSLMRISYAVFCLKKKNPTTYRKNIKHLLIIVMYIIQTNNTL